MSCWWAPSRAYVLRKCYANYGREDYDEEFYRAAETAEAVTFAWGTHANFLRLNDILARIELRTAGGDHLWGESDPVHLAKQQGDQARGLVSRASFPSTTAGGEGQAMSGPLSGSSC